MKHIHKVAILGAGTMGARIAAHFANAGVPLCCSISFLPTPTAPPATKSPPPDSMLRENPSPRHSSRLAGQPRHRRQFRRRLEKTGRCRLDHRGHRREPRHQALLVKESRGHPQARHHHHHQHQRTSRRQNCRRIFRRLPPLLVRHALLQSAALHAPAGADPHSRRRSRAASTPSPISATCNWAKASCSRKTRPTSSAIASAHFPCST